MRIPILLLLSLAAAAQAPPPGPPPYVPTEDERAQINARTTELGKLISLLKAGRHDPVTFADVEVYHKALSWLLRHPEEFYNKSYVASALIVGDRGVERAKALQEGRAPWTSEKGKRVAMAYRSRVDDGVQPYVVVVPEAYDPSRPSRLDVVLHGRGATLSEVSFIAQAEQAKPAVAYPDRIELHVFGRTNNAYRWAGETDVYEALASVQSRFKIDTDRTILRGFSMGGAGTWHIGLHDPGRWVGIEAGAGFNETLRYAKQSNLPPYVEKTLHIYDAMDYARNAFNVPTVGYGGEIDPQLQASKNIQDQLASENLTLPRALFLVGPQTPHRFHPDSKKQSDAFLDSYAKTGRQTPDKISFVTYTPRYNECAWITVDELEQIYERAQVDADAGVITTRNVGRIQVRRPGPITLDGQKFAKGGTFEKQNGKWGPAGAGKKLTKHRGLQGPIDDAFMDSFLVVRPSDAAPLATKRMDTFLRDYAKFLRADPRVADDKSVTPAQIRDHNLILFGDPSSNSVIRKIASKLPMGWDGASIKAGGRTFPGNEHLLVMIYPNPLNPSKYVVINSGHTFGAAEFRGTNALLFPRLGDWAVIDGAAKPQVAGLFDRYWK